MRLFVTSYQKSGTHQVMPMFHDRTSEMPMVVDNTGLAFSKMPEMYGGGPEPWDGPSPETIAGLKAFPYRAFGHLAYHEAYYEALQSRPTKIIFNVRDPRDVVVAEFENIRRYIESGRSGRAFLDIDVTIGPGESVALIKRKNPINDLICMAAYRWPVWLGWIGRTHVKLVHYEDLRLKPRETVHEISEWVAPHIPPGEETMVANLYPKRRNPTFRKGAVGEWKKYFTPSMTKLAEEKLGYVITALGYPMEGYHVEIP